MIYIQKITPEEVLRLQEQFDAAARERAVHVEKAIKDSPYAAMPLSEKREIARDVLSMVPTGEGARTVDDMDEATINNVLIIGLELEVAAKDWDANYKAFMDEMAENQNPDANDNDGPA